jgi:predicted RNase H-like HicB family nuclease
MKNISFYMKQRYTIEIKSYPDKMYCAEIKEIPGLCAYSTSEKNALDELEIVKRTAFELMIEQKKAIPLPSIRFEIPIADYEKFSFKNELEKYALI